MHNSSKSSWALQYLLVVLFWDQALPCIPVWSVTIYTDQVALNSWWHSENKSSSCHLVLFLFVHFLISTYPVLVLSPFSIATAANITSHTFQAQTLLPFTLSIPEQSCPFLLHEYFLLLTLTVSQVPSIPSVWLSSWVISINCSSTECLGAKVLQASFLDLLFFSGNTVTPRDDGFILQFHMSRASWKLSDVHIFMTSLWISNSHSQLPTEKLFADLNKHGTGKKKVHHLASIGSDSPTLCCFQWDS